MRESSEMRRKLIWKYFWKRKRQEIWAAKWGILFIQMMILFAAVLVFATLVADGQEEYQSMAELSIYILCTELVLLLFGVIIYALIRWLRQNWKLATNDATVELKRRRRK